jgi:rhamnose transport system permease protein
MIRRHAREISVAAALFVLLGILAVAAPGFFRSSHLRGLLLSNAPLLVAVAGMTMVLLARQIDISIGSQYSIAGILAALMGKAGWPLPAAVAGTLAAGAAMGALNGALVAGLGLPPIVVTLASMVALREGLLWARSGAAVQNLPDGFRWFGEGQGTGQWIVVLASVAVPAACIWGLRSLAAGRRVYAVGSDPEAARLAGIRPGPVVFTLFTLMGALTALAALLSAVQARNLQPNEGTGLELKVIAAAVVGGVAISGGRGTLAGALLGLLLLVAIAPALVFLGTEAYWEKAIQGAIILIAVASDAFNLRQRRDAGASLATH